MQVDQSQANAHEIFQNQLRQNSLIQDVYLQNEIVNDSIIKGNTANFPVRFSNHNLDGNKIEYEDECEYEDPLNQIPDPDQQENVMYLD